MPRAFVSVLLFACGLAHAAGPHPSLPPPVVPECLGVNIHFTDPKPGEMEMLAAAGFKWVRMDFTWASTERQRGEYDFSAYDRLVAALDQFKLRAVFILDYGNPLYAEPGDQQPFTSRVGTPEFREAFGKWAVAVVSHFKGRGYLWEMWNEPNHEGFWKPKANVADYAALAKATGEALRSARLIAAGTTEPGKQTASGKETVSGENQPERLKDISPGQRPGLAAPTGARPEGAQEANASPAPAGASAPENPKPRVSPGASILRPSGTAGECFIGPATSTIDLAFLEGCFKAGLLEYWDAVSVHPYRQQAPETAEEEYRSLRLLIRKYAPAGRTIPIISGEWGYSTQYPAFAGKDAAARDEQQAKWLARMFLTNIANDVALSIWYDWHDDGTNPTEPEHHFGVVAHEYHAGRDPVYDPKPAYTAMKTMTEQLGGFRFNKRLGLEKKEYRLLFQSDAMTELVLWQDRLPHPYGFGLLTPEHAFQVKGVDGRLIALPVGRQENRNIFGDSPLYVLPTDEQDKRAWSIAASWGRLRLEFIASAPSQLELRSSLQNPLAIPIQFDVLTFHSWPGQSYCVSGFSEPAPRMELAEHSQVAEFIRLPVELRRQDQTVSQALMFWLDGKQVEPFYQAAPLVVPNYFTAEELPPSASQFLVRLHNPSGEAFSGSASLRVMAKSGAAVWHNQALALKEGESERVIGFPLELDDPEVPLPIQWPQITLRIASESQSPVWFEQLLWRPHTFLSLQAAGLTAAFDGASDVKATARLEDSESQQASNATQRRSVQLSYRFESGWKFCRLICKEPAESIIPNLKRETYDWYPVKFGVWLHGDGKGCQARVRFKDSTGQVFQPDGPRIDWKGWRYVTFPMQATEETPLAHWGGANDGVIHYPIEWDSIFLLDNVSRQPVEGEIYLSAPTLIY